MKPVTLLCLPYAGGHSAVFRMWSRVLPNWIQVETVDLPGHGARHSQRSLSTWDDLVGWLVNEVGGRIEPPYGIFGHSMGALVGLELAHALRASQGHAPIWFGASGCRAPSRREFEAKWLNCPEDELIAELRELGGTPPELLESRQLLDLVLPMLRNDFHLCGVYERTDRAPLDCPIFVLGGTEDHDVSEPRSNLTEWALETTGPCSLGMIEGGHFFVERRRDEVLRIIERSLRAARAARERLHA